ncbi:hypothetical protein CYMTET_52639 [Cymbomonas tetramitiformis]|uniref:Reverse transcriptase Ty1/copia-type domain-containing protein n=1 Tax=Cymbomonas tetramitiformis TaxID=36881 RepID=A0AAE0BIW1_9CHLO|nr:hypothetical protein CYMTET_52639 [Cymbomonas tetramitiformis]
MGYDTRMQRSNVEPCLYYTRTEELFVFILAYVDDYIVATSDKQWYDTFVQSFHARYPCKDLGVLDLVMGIGVRWSSGAAYLSQSGYITQMIEAYGLQDARPASLPMTPGCALVPSDGRSSLPYRALLGQLQWIASCTRPDIMAAVSALSRFCTTYGEEHFMALKQVVRYLKGTLDYELVMRRASVPGGSSSHTTTLPVCIYTDADYAGCKNTRKFTSGIAMFPCGSLVIFSSMMQKCVSLSITEAEIIAMSEGAREIKYILNVLDGIVDIHKPIPMYCDNQGAIHLASDYVNNSRSKHIEVQDTMHTFWNEGPSESANIYSYGLGSELNWIRKTETLRSYPLMVLILSMVIGICAGGVSCYVVWARAIWAFNKRHAYLLRQLRYAHMKHKLETEDKAHSKKKKVERRKTHVTVVSQGILSTRVSKVLVENAPPGVSQPFSHSAFFHTEVLVEYLRRSFMDPLELFIYSLPQKEGSQDGLITGMDDAQTLAEEQGTDDGGGVSHIQAARERELNSVPLKRFKMEFNRFCVQHGILPRGEIQDKKLILELAGLAIKRNVSQVDSFVCLGWRNLPAATMDAIVADAASRTNRLTDTITLFLQTNCVATGQETDAIPVVELSMRYNAFCHRIGIPQDQRMQMDNNTQQILAFGAQLVPRQESLLVEGLYVDTIQVTREVPLAKSLTAFFPFPHAFRSFYEDHVDIAGDRVHAISGPWVVLAVRSALSSSAQGVLFPHKEAFGIFRSMLSTPLKRAPAFIVFLLFCGMFVVLGRCWRSLLSITPQELKEGIKVDFSIGNIKKQIKNQVFLRAQSAMDRVMAGCFMEHESGLYRPRMQLHQWAHVGLKCIFSPYSKLWDLVLPALQVRAALVLPLGWSSAQLLYRRLGVQAPIQAVVPMDFPIVASTRPILNPTQVGVVFLLPLPMLMIALYVQASDRVMYASDPEINIFVWSDWTYLWTLSDQTVMAEKLKHMRPLVKCIFYIIPIYLIIGLAAFVCHVTGLRAWDPEVFVQHSYLKRIVTGTFNALCLLTLFTYTSYLGMLAGWLLLGAILNPDAFLPYGVAVLTTLTVAYQRCPSVAPPQQPAGCQLDA